MKVQIANLLYIVLFTFVGPALIGVELYGVSLVLLIPVMLFGAILEPIWQHRFGLNNHESGKAEVDCLSLSKVALLSFACGVGVFFFYQVDFIEKLIGSFAACVYLLGVYLLAFYYNAGLHRYIVRTLLCNAFIFIVVLVGLARFYEFEYLYLYSFVAAQFVTVLLGVAMLAGDPAVLFRLAPTKSRSPITSASIVRVLEGALRWRFINIYYFNISLFVISFFSAPAAVGALKYSLSFASAFRFLYPLNVPMLHVAASQGKFGLVRRACVNKYVILQVLLCLVLGSVFLFDLKYKVPYFEVDEIVQSLLGNWLVIALTPIVLVAPSVNSLIMFKGGDRALSLPVQIFVVLTAISVFLVTGFSFVLFIPVAVYLFLVCYMALLRGVDD